MPLELAAAIAAVVAAFIAGIASIVSTVITARSNKEVAKYQEERRKELDAESIQRNEDRWLREAEQNLLLAMADALDVDMVAAKGGHLNGNVDRARRDLAKAKHEFQETRTKAITHTLY